MAKNRTVEEWQYQWVNSKGKNRWITEDDQQSAEWKAQKSSGATGKVRRRLVITKITKWEESNVKS